MDTTELTEPARALLRRIQGAALRVEITRRMLVRAHWRGLGPREVDAALAELAGAGLIQPVQRATAGRPTTIYRAGTGAFGTATAHDAKPWLCLQCGFRDCTDWGGTCPACEVTRRYRDPQHPQGRMVYRPAP